MNPEPCKPQVGPTEPLRLVPPANNARSSAPSSGQRPLAPVSARATQPPASAPRPTFAAPAAAVAAVANVASLAPPPPPLPLRAVPSPVSIAPPVAVHSPPPPPAPSPVAIAPHVVAPRFAEEDALPLFGVPRWRAALTAAIETVRRTDVQQLVTKLRHTDYNKLIVSAYKLTGFAVLTVIVFGLISYLGANVFYAVSTTWLQPTLVSATDEHVLPLRTKLTELIATRDRLAAELADRERAVAMHEDYAKSLRGTLEANLEIRRGELKQLSTLRKTYTQSRRDIVSANRAFAAMSRVHSSADFDAHLIDRDTAVNGNYQRFQIANGNLAFQEKAIDIVERADTAARDADGIEAILNGAPGERLTIDVLRIKQEYRRSQLELAKASDDRKLTAESLGRYEELVKAINDSPYMKATNGSSTIALVPYDNAENMKPGTPIYGCHVGLFFCTKVGKVVERLDGEVTVKHPVRNQTVRGQTVQVQLDDARWARHPVLFAGGRPVLF